MTKESFKKVKFHKRQLVINKEVQWAIISYSITLSIAVLSGYHVLQSLSQDDPEHSNIVAYGLIFVFFTAIIFYGLYLTNRIAGPIYKLKIHMEKLAEGQEVEDIAFRKNDYFKELAELFNKLNKVNKTKK